MLLAAVAFLSWPNSSPAPIIFRPGEGWSYESLGGGGRQPISVMGGPKTGRLGQPVGDILKRTNRGAEGEGGRG